MQQITLLHVMDKAHVTVEFELIFDLETLSSVKSETNNFGVT